MSRKEKLLSRLLGKPKDFTYSELASLLGIFGYHEIKSGRTSGSRVAFCNPDKHKIIRLHKPHPDQFLKLYQMEMIIEFLKSEGVL